MAGKRKQRRNSRPGKIIFRAISTSLLPLSLTVAPFAFRVAGPVTASLSLVGSAAAAATSVVCHTSLMRLRNSSTVAGATAAALGRPAGIVQELLHFFVLSLTLMGHASTVHEAGRIVAESLHADSMPMWLWPAGLALAVTLAPRKVHTPVAGLAVLCLVGFLLVVVILRAVTHTADILLRGDRAGLSEGLSALAAVAVWGTGFNIMHMPELIGSVPEVSAGRLLSWPLTALLVQVTLAVVVGAVGYDTYRQETDFNILQSFLDDGSAVSAILGGLLLVASAALNVGTVIHAIRHSVIELLLLIIPADQIKKRGHIFDIEINITLAIVFSIMVICATRSLSMIALGLSAFFVPISSLLPTAALLTSTLSGVVGKAGRVAAVSSLAVNIGMIVMVAWGLFDLIWV